MTEAEWLTCTDPGRMLDYLEDSSSDRKLRLFVCAGCRRVWLLLTYDRSTRGVEVAERYADGKATARELARSLSPSLLRDRRLVGPGRDLAYAAARFFVVSTPDTVGAAQSALLRCIFGNPFRPVSFNPDWQTPTVRGLATAAYDERILPSGTLDPDHLAVLADALEDAGCDNVDLPSHLRGPGPHVRGCWVIDLLLRKE